MFSPEELRSITSRHPSSSELAVAVNTHLTNPVTKTFWLNVPLLKVNRWIVSLRLTKGIYRFIILPMNSKSLRERVMVQ
jgi:hypothetical protein